MILQPDFHILPNMEPNIEAVKLLLEEATRVGKCPWCCCAVTERYVYEKLNPVGFVKDGISYRVEAYPQESFEETQRRRKNEKS